MPQFRPFIGTRYNPAVIENFTDVVAPPYDVINSDERRRLENLSPYNAVRLILPDKDENHGPGEIASTLLRKWLSEDVLIDDNEAAFYLYRMGFEDESGRKRQTSGVIGALSLNTPDEILPHEETMPKPLGEQLALIQAARTNLSPIYLLTPATGVSLLLEPPGPPDYRCTDSDGTHHRIWRLTSPAILDALTDAIAVHPLVVADGHHRYQTACKHAANDSDPAAQWIMAFIVELTDSELWVRPTHRQFLDADPDDVATAFHKVFPGCESINASPSEITEALSAGRTVLIGQGSPSPAVASPPWTEGTLQDSQLLESLPVTRLHMELLPLLPVEGRIEFEPDLKQLLDATASGRATAAIALPPVTVETIRRIATAGLKMPQKTTYFFPKPRSGAVFRRFEADSQYD